MSDFEKYLAERMKDPAFKAEYDSLESEFSIIQATIDAQKTSGLTRQQPSVNVTPKRNDQRNKKD